MLWQLQNHPVGTSRRINVDSLSILRQYIKDEILTNFHFISTYFFDVIRWLKNPRCFTNFFWRSFAGQKIHVVTTYFIRCNFDGRAIYVVSTYFLQYDFDGQKTHAVST